MENKSQVESTNTFSTFGVACHTELFEQLRDYSGIREIVEQMIEIDRQRFMSFFDELDPDKIEENHFGARFATFLSSLIEQRYEWFYNELV